MSRSFRRFIIWRAVLITIIVISSGRTVIGPVIPVMPVISVMPVMTLMPVMALMTIMALMTVVAFIAIMPVMTLLAVMLVVAQMYSRVGRSANVRFGVAVPPVSGAASFETMRPGNGNIPRNKQETSQYNRKLFHNPLEFTFKYALV